MPPLLARTLANECVLVSIDDPGVVRKAKFKQAHESEMSNSAKRLPFGQREPAAVNM